MLRLTIFSTIVCICLIIVDLSSQASFLLPCDCGFFVSNKCTQSNLPRKSQSDACSTDYCLSIRLNKYRNADQQRQMSSEDKRNTIIVELNKLTKASIRWLQKRDNCGLLEIFIEYEYARRFLTKGAKKLVKRVFRQTPPSKNQLHICTHVIAQWTYDALRSNMPSGTLVRGDAAHKSQGARIDNQSGVVRHNNMNYYNIQVQMFGDTFATVMVPAAVNIGRRKIRNALVESLKRNKQVIISPGSTRQNSWWLGVMSAVGGIIALLAA
ncbi:unnamed protein product [Rotaria sordida]|uniref:Uncharacterized protein n=1 Tax=Rotaria sordida TaxID=392033 RepID=A0A819RK68_9BILA|nr:unnamed protein product [Rotaria sordida]CAF1183829.1 unnamed protein product [Rotaria sordida]CAF1264296.1 unnamed protein product [Rotaria sordida]CAF1544142.1 unnamed protein product [Rotaria sordida]CAF4048471.1 unnamed protein product [Rotaria sordida]